MLHFNIVLGDTEQPVNRKSKKKKNSLLSGVPRVDLRGQKEANADKQRQRERAINKRRGRTTERRVWTQRPTKLNCLTSLLSNGPKSRKQGDTLTLTLTLVNLITTTTKKITENYKRIQKYVNCLTINIPPVPLKW